MAYRVVRTVYRQRYSIEVFAHDLKVL